MPKVRHWSMTCSEKSKKPNFILLCRYSSVVEHVIGNDGVVSPILTSGTIFKNSVFMADFFFLNNSLFSPIFEVFKIAFFTKLSDFLCES